MQTDAGEKISKQRKKSKPKRVNNKHKPFVLLLVECLASRHNVQSEEVSSNTECRRKLKHSRLEQVVICGRITCERSFCPLIERRWRVGIRNGYWLMVALSASTLMTRQCNLTWSREVQRCWWVFRVPYSHLYSLYLLNFVILHQRHSISVLPSKMDLKIKNSLLQDITPK